MSDPWYCHEISLHFIPKCLAFSPVILYLWVHETGHEQEIHGIPAFFTENGFLGLENETLSIFP